MLKLFPAILAFTSALSAHGGQVLHVSPTGDDANDGTTAKPFATLVRARDEIRALKKRDTLPAGGVTVEVAPGSYRVTETFLLGKGDSGTAESPILYRCDPGKRAWLDGGRKVLLADFKPLTNPDVLARLPENARPHVRCINLKELGIAYLERLPDAFNTHFCDAKYFAQLQVFYGGKPLYEARWPNQGFEHFNDVLDCGSKEDGGRFTFTSDPERLKRWAKAEDLILHGYFRRDYYSFSSRAAIDLENSSIKLARGLVDESHHTRRFYAHHLPEELDMPGEWYLHRKTGLFCLWPPEGNASDHLMFPEFSGPNAIVDCPRKSRGDRDLDVAASPKLTAPMVRIDGAQYVSLHGFGIQGGRQNAITVRSGSHNTITACEIRACGWYGAIVAGGNNVRIAGCDIHDMGFGGIILSGGDRKTLTPSGHVAENNHLHHLSHVVRNYTEPLLLKGVGCRAAHNLIHHTPHIAVRYYGNDHIMEFNEIYQVASETSECGIFYTGYDWASRGNIIRYNFLHHIDGVGGSPRFAHLDDSASGTEIHGNVSYLMSDGPAIMGGNENLIHDNICIECESAGSISPRGHEDMMRVQTEKLAGHYVVNTPAGFVAAPRGKMGYGLIKRLKRLPIQTPPWSTRYPKLLEIFSKDPIAAPWFNVITRNVIVDCARGINASGAVKKEWATIEENWRVDDPGFVEPDRTKMDFRLKPDAEIYKKGFQPIPFEKIGLYESPERASWPVKPEPAAADWRPNWILRREADSRASVTVFPVNSLRKGRSIVIDGNVTPEEWSPPDYDPVDPDRHKEILIQWGMDQKNVPNPSKAYIEMDEKNLYVAFVNPVDPEHGVTGGHRWGRNDAVEVALAPVQDAAKQGAEVPLVFRGYTDGHAECATEPGWLEEEVQRVMGKGVTYAMKVNGPGEWSAEWCIPFAALGIAPMKRSCPILAHLCVRKVGGNQWVQWKKRKGTSWKVHGAFALWLVPCGPLPFVPGE